MRGEEVGACIILREGEGDSEASARKIFEFCNEKLVYYKLPAYFMFVAKLPMTASQKIQRGEVKKLSATMLEQGSCIDLRELKRKRK